MSNLWGTLLAALSLGVAGLWQGTAAGSLETVAFGDSDAAGLGMDPNG